MDEIGENGSPEAALVQQNEWSGLAQFWVKVVAVILRALAFPLFVGLHWGIDYLMGLVVPDGMEKLLHLAKVGVFLVFLCVYVQLAVEILAVFMPSIRPRSFSFRMGQVKVEIGDGSGFKK